jgi:hypothetical protein
MHRHSVIALIIALAAASAGCHRAAPGAEDRELVYRADAVLTVRVVNHSQLDATIYLVHDGTRERLGTVTAASTSAFSVRGRSLANGDFVLVADPVGAIRASTTEPLHASQGTEFIWTLEADFSRNSVIVRG